jgi:phage baseplate assembly protein W
MGPDGRDAAFLGVGWGFPLALDETGELAMAAHEEDIRQSIRILLGTEPGERVMRPDFGAGLGALVFEPLNTTTMALVRERVRQALIRWEARIDLVEVAVRAPQPALGLLEIEIRYRVRATNAFYNLVYPFYLSEGETT